MSFSREYPVGIHSNGYDLYQNWLDGPFPEGSVWGRFEGIAKGTADSLEAALRLKVRGSSGTTHQPLVSLSPGYPVGIHSNGYDLYQNWLHGPFPEGSVWGRFEGIAKGTADSLEAALRLKVSLKSLCLCFLPDIQVKV